MKLGPGCLGRPGESAVGVDEVRDVWLPSLSKRVLCFECLLRHVSGSGKSDI